MILVSKILGVLCVHLNIHHFLHQYGYWGVLFVLLVEMIGIPFPAETTLTLSGIEWSSGVFKIVPLIIAAVAGNIIGSSIAYGIGRLLGRPFIVRFGKYVGITSKRLDQANHIFYKNKSWIVIICKFIAGIRVLIPYLAGINKVNFVVFTILNAISAFLWVTLFVFLGRYVGIEWTRYHHVFHQYLVPGIIVIVLIIGIIVFLKIRTKLKT